MLLDVEQHQGERDSALFSDILKSIGCVRSHFRVIGRHFRKRQGASGSFTVSRVELTDRVADIGAVIEMGVASLKK